MKTTIKDVALQANVSISTVSRIINNQPGYSEATKEKVEKVIKEMGFHPNGLARGLIHKKTHTIGVLLPNIISSFSSKLLNGIEESAHENHFSTIVCNTGPLGNRTLEYLSVLGEKKVDGIILTSSPLKEEYYKEIKALDIPVILLSSMSYRYSVPYVKVDDKQAAYHAASYLIQNGHTKIAMISGSQDDELAGLPRYEGFIKALGDHGLSVNENIIVYGDFGFQSGRTSMEQLLPFRDEFTAIFVASDDMAMGAISVASEHNLKVPDDFSVIGYDNTNIAEMAIPPLTTVAQPLREMGKVAITKLIEMINNQDTIASAIMAHEIIERKTVKKIIST
ncbi:LacI family DNA-binding transcriptional regulator [Halalkalibacter kiskunsagensis]|uniref:LacI family DNA-binding transcriptional regulator n=1 Tax=Halalkalibacter kiskunsagensis TaxID=1548599 RepID=A0ABV6K951_9BACI